MEWYFILLIVLACLFGLYLLYKAMQYILRFLRWVWRSCCWPPMEACYRGCLAPVGRCCRDSVFVCKECCCDCSDRCDRCMHPYQRI